MSMSNSSINNGSMSGGTDRPHRARYIHLPAAHFGLVPLLSADSTVNAMFAWARQRSASGRGGYSSSGVLLGAQWRNDRVHPLTTPTQRVLLLVRAHAASQAGRRLAVLRLLVGYAGETALAQLGVRDAAFAPLPASPPPADGSVWGALAVHGRAPIAELALAFENQQLVEEVVVVRADKLAPVLAASAPVTPVAPVVPAPVVPAPVVPATVVPAPAPAPAPTGVGRGGGLPRPDAAGLEGGHSVIDTAASLEAVTASFMEQNTRLEQQLTIAKERGTRSRLTGAPPAPPESPMHF